MLTPKRLSLRRKSLRQFGTGEVDMDIPFQLVVHLDPQVLLRNNLLLLNLCVPHDHRVMEAYTFWVKDNFFSFSGV